MARACPFEELLLVAYVEASIRRPDSNASAFTAPDVRLAVELCQRFQLLHLVNWMDEYFDCPDEVVRAQGISFRHFTAYVFAVVRNARELAQQVTAAVRAERIEKGKVNE